jgi:hypothetical protein
LSCDMFQGQPKGTRSKHSPGESFPGMLQTSFFAIVFA